MTDRWRNAVLAATAVLTVSCATSSESSAPTSPINTAGTTVDNGTSPAQGSVTVPITPSSTLALDAPSRNLIATTFGGSKAEGTAVAVNDAGEEFIAGTTESSDGWFADPTNSIGPLGGPDLFVARLDSGGQPTWWTRLGGTGDDEIWSVAVDTTGAVYLYGSTDSIDLPTTDGAFDRSFGGGDLDAFVMKLDPSGAALEYSTYLGGNNTDEGSGVIVVDATGAGYVAGRTASSDFPTTTGAFQTVFAGGDGKLASFGPGKDAFVARLDPSGSSLMFSTFIGGSGDDASSTSPAVDPEGNIYVAGATTSTDFPVTAGSLQAQSGGGPTQIPSDGWVMKLDPSGSRSIWSTYIGGSAFDTFHAVAIDSQDAVYVTGASCGEFPITEHAPQSVMAGGCDHLVAKIDPSGARLVYASYLGGSDSEMDDERIVVDSAGRAIVVADTTSTDYPVTPDAFQPANAGDLDLTITILSTDGSQFEYSTYFGGSARDSDWGSAPQLTANGDLIVPGSSDSPNLPAIAAGVEPAGLDDVLLLRLSIGS